MPSVVNETNFQREVIEAPRPVLVHFWTPWCGLCQLIEPMLSTMQVGKEELIKVVAINADDNFKLTNYYRLKNLPTLMLFKDGELVQKLDGFTSRDRLYQALTSLMDNSLSLY